MKVLEAMAMDEIYRDDVLSENLVKNGTLKNTKIKGGWRGWVEYRVLKRQCLRSQGYKRISSKKVITRVKFHRNV